jgi:prepilin-type N-terminal cleavage/methylation domain-containing protein/prepilin-type processing-associated H-X9-DG protein
MHGHGFNELECLNLGQLHYLDQLIFKEPQRPKKYNFFCLAVQCPKGHSWIAQSLERHDSVYTPSHAVVEIIQGLMQELPIDRDRIVLTGVSTGGTAGWEMAIRYPDLFAAVAPLASVGTTSPDLHRIAHIPTWAFHTREDPDIPITGVRNTVGNLRLLSRKVWLTETAGYSHDCWATAFSDCHLLEWLLAQAKGVDGPIPQTRRFSVEIQMIKQEIYANGPQYYLVLPAAIVFCWWFAKKELTRRRIQKCNALAESDPMDRSGFTVVELLVVIAIIGVLVALLLPAVQMARESSRRGSCANNLRHQAVAVKLHEGTHKIFPTGGWGGEWLGDPDAGYGPKQPGGWIYNVLSFIEQDNLRQLGRGLRGRGAGSGDPRTTEGDPRTTFEDAMVTLMQSPVPVFYCPSRRLPGLYPYTGGELKNFAKKPPEKVAKTDYAISRTISHEKSEVIMPDVQLQGKGASKTVLAGEKSLGADAYESGGAGDSLVAYVGDCDDIRREPTRSPTPDRGAGSGDPRTTEGSGDPRTTAAAGFGAAHPSGANIAYCDGSVRFVLEDEQLEP